MLRELRIKNFAIIDLLNIEFDPGLIIFTGETGAGKSIIVEALGLTLGSKISPDDIRSGEDKGYVEALFDITKEAPLKKRLEEIGIQTEDGELILKKTFSSSGKSKSYINNNLVTLTVLSEVGKRLVDFHGQHHHQTLLHQENHIDIIDSYGKLLSRRDKLTQDYIQYCKLKRELDHLAKDNRERIQREDLIRFQMKEIDEAGLKTGEDTRLKEEKNILANSEKLYESSQELYELLYSSEGSIIEQLGKITNILHKMVDIDKSLKDALKDGENNLVQLEELSRTLKDYEKSLEFNPERLTELDDRLALINSLRRKYGSTIEEILRYRESLDEELDRIVHHDQKIFEIKKRLKELEDELRKAALKLSRERRKIALKIEGEVKKELKELGMDRVAFRVRFSHSLDEDSFIKWEGNSVSLKEKGIDNIEFLFSPNLGEELRPLSKIASGGEISRMMLALKSILTRDDNIPIMVFDEVDSGIGGRIAEIVGLKLKKVSRGHQVFCITHLPQIASQGDYHFKVTKEIQNKRTIATIKELTSREKVEEIARMSGGKKITETTRKYAKELLDK
ncbi:MAG TPA: DNA repair protein RecN [Nitrospinota bacterium]|nr:DNA repair protein RecN [Nitrospinota bacterium]